MRTITIVIEIPDDASVSVSAPKIEMVNMDMRYSEMDIFDVLTEMKASGIWVDTTRHNKYSNSTPRRFANTLIRGSGTRKLRDFCLFIENDYKDYPLCNTRNYGRRTADVVNMMLNYVGYTGKRRGIRGV